MSLMSRCRTAVQATTVICLLLGASAAQAQDVPFAFLIVNGWQAFYAGPAVRIDQAMTSWYALGQIHAITNTQKGAEIGTANLQVFSRTVPDPTFATLGPLAGLISLNLGTLRGHLAVFETPAGLRSTVAILDSSGTTDLRVSGTWAIGDGSAVGGGSPNDMVVGGIAHFGTPLPAGNVAVTLGPYFPLVPFVNDQSFSVRASGSPLPWQVGAGSSYHNSTYGPIRTYMRSDAGGFFDDFTSAISVLHTGGDNYVVLTCSWYTVMSALSPASPVPSCALSGVGPTLSRLTGRVTSYEMGTLLDRLMRWQVFLAP